MFFLWSKTILLFHPTLLANYPHNYPIMAEDIKPISTYNEDNIVHLDDREHIRRRPGMYIGKLGDGKHDDDGIYVLIKETIDNSIDEFRMNEGKVVEVSVRPYTDEEGY